MARKKAESEKVLPITVYVKKSVIDEIGGIAEARDLALDSLVNHNIIKYLTENPANIIKKRI